MTQDTPHVIPIPGVLAAAAAAKSLLSCHSVQLHRRQPTRLPRPWDSPGKNTGVGCRLLLQCMKVKSEREVAQSCSTPRDPMDCSPPGSSVHGIFQARALEWGAIAFSAWELPNSVTLQRHLLDSQPDLGKGSVHWILWEAFPRGARLQPSFPPPL